MAGPQIDVSANVGQAKQAIDQIDRAIDNASKTAERANKKQYRPLAPGALDELREAVKLMERMGALSPNMPGGGPSSRPPAPAPAPAPYPPSRDDDDRPSSRGRRPRGGRWSHYGEHGTAGRFFNAFSSSLGGGASTIAGEAMSGARGAGGFSGMGLMRGGLIGAGLFGAYKAGQMVMEGYENAKTLALEMDKLKRQMGDVGVSFNVLQAAAEAASAGLEINAVEAGKLMTEFNRLAGGVKDSGDLADGTRTGVGMSKAFGLDPNSGVSFLANIRNIMRGGSADGDRKLALMIGDVVTRSGMNGRVDEILQAVQSFASATSRISLTNPNMAGFSGMYAGMLSSRIPGLTPETAAAMLGQANSAMMNMGAFGEASHTFTLSAFNRFGKLNPIQAQVLAEGGLYGSRAGAFGKGSVYRQYMMASGMSASEVDKLIGENGSVSNYQAIRQHLDAQNVDPHIKAEMAKNYFGLSSMSQAMAMLSIKPEDIGKTERMLGARGLDLKSYNESGIMTLSRIANAGGIGDLQSIAGDMLGRKGKGALTSEEAATLTKAMKDGGFKELQDTLADLAAGKDKQETLGSQMIDQQKRIENAMIGVGQTMLGPLQDIKSILMAGFKVSETKARENVRDIRKNEINEDINKRVAAANLAYNKEGTVESAKMRRFLGAPGVDDAYVESRERAKREMESQVQALEKERAERLGKVDRDFSAEEEARRRSRVIEGSAGGASMTSTKQEFVNTYRAGAEAAGRELGVDPKLLLAQAGLETGWGRSVIPGTNNLGNIKAGRSWTGDTKRAYDKAEGSYDEYRVYGSTEDYWKDYASLIRRKYPGVIGVGSDSAAFARALKAGGYATDPAYESKIVNTASGLDLDYGGISTPLPYNNFSLTRGVQAPIMINGEFKLVGQDNMPRAMPLFISKEVPMPSSAGSRRG